MPSVTDALNLFYPAAIAAYASQDVTHLIVGNGFTVSAPIVVDPQKAAQIPPKHLPLLASMLKLSPVFGFIAARPGAVLVTFRGTETPGDWLCDLEAEPATCQVGSGAVHEGFQKVYEIVQASALKGLNSALQPGDQLLVTGHSLGGALALLFADDVAPLHEQLQVCTFAGPRTGLMDFAKSYNQRVPNTLRVVNVWDVVPNVPVPVPPACLYEHVGSALVIDGGFTLDVLHAHSLPLSYLPGLKKKIT